MPIPSMSKIDLLFECQWWAREEVVEIKTDPGLPARYGSAFHLLLARMLLGEQALPEKVAKQFGVDSPKQLYQHALSSFRSLQTWLTKENEYSLKLAPPSLFYVERSYALNVEEMKARVCKGPTDDTHEYLDRRPGEICGTADLVIFPHEAPETVVVIDHKTGNYIDPAESRQLKTLALAICLRYKMKKAIVGVFHSPALEMPTLYAAQFSLAELKAHGARLQKKYARADSGYVRPGDWCKYCPGRGTCPTKTTGLVHLGFKGNKLRSAEQVGRIHMALGELAASEKLLRDLMRQFVKKNGPTPRPDGKVLTLSKRTRRTLSMQSIKDALGEATGTVEIRRLEKLGCTPEIEYEELRALNDG